MTEDLQGLLEKINRDGVEKAQAEAASILADAQAKAAAIVKDAETAAAKAKAAAEKAASDYAARAEETVAQAERDTLLKIEGAVTALLEKLLRAEVDKALADPETVSSLAAEAVKGFALTGEIAAPAQLAAALKAKLAAEPKFTVVTDETLDTGFSVRLDGGRIEHTFTGAAVAAELAKRLRPDLAKLLA